jgi:hypothetical protein
MYHKKGKKQIFIGMFGSGQNYQLVISIVFSLAARAFISSLLSVNTRPTVMTKLHIEIRKVQALTGERSLTLVLPKAYATELGIEKGHFLKCHIEDQKLVLEKAKL